MLDRHVHFHATLELYPTAKAAWVFVTLPAEAAEYVRFYVDSTRGHLPKRGFNSVPVHVTIGNTIWKTSLFPDKKSQSYLLPIKEQVRKSERLSIHQSPAIHIEIL